MKDVHFGRKLCQEVLRLLLKDVKRSKTELSIFVFKFDYFSIDFEMKSIGLYYEEYNGKYLIYTLCCRAIRDGHTLNPIERSQKI